MWEIVNGTPFSAGGYFLRDRAGLEHWVVAVRARFTLQPGQLPRLAAPPPIRLAPAYTGEDASELVGEADLAPFRPHPDIILHGEAQPPGDGATSRLLAMKLGTLEKRVQAFGPRHVRRQGRQWLVERRPFEPFRLSWTRSLGGRDLLAEEGEAHPANPIGTGWSKRLADAPDGTAFFLPQLERPGSLMHPGRPAPEPTGFGPIMPNWRPRADRAGTYDAAWQRDHAPLPPPDFSEAFHQAAPDDQVYTAPLKGGEPVVLEGFGPEEALEFALPQLLLDARTRYGAGTVDSRFRPVAIEIDATARTLDMVLNAAIPCPEGDHLVRRTTVFLQQMSGFDR